MNKIEQISHNDEHPYLMLVQSLNREIRQLELHGDSIDWQVIDNQLGDRFTDLLPNQASLNQPNIPITGFRNFNAFVSRLAKELNSIFYQSQDVFTQELSAILIDNNVPNNPTFREVDSMLSTDNPDDLIKLLKLAGIIMPIVDRKDPSSNLSPFKIPKEGIEMHKQEIINILHKE